ncbi:ATP-binding domain-containing protein [Streptomyces sp. MP131-18]|uniref:HelD family protein n=1 Tax=Streptomyces sp. MP131-18 TaxID=1857892 RepID=UPI00097BAFBB|nr:ATP-binding domain-containing protein [Streptomyces sp. MP131-18]ONK11415.1 Helicase IV [Streptomyces sp. MP131-18]
MSTGGRTGDLTGEQAYLTRLYGRLDELRAEAGARLEGVLAATGLGHQGLAERDVAADELARRAARLDAVENGLCFGRLDMDDDERRYVGRMGILDGSADFEPLLIDWRAPAARPFYAATARSTEGVRRRRHIRTSGRRVTGVLDEEFDGLAEPAGDAALLAAVDAARTGRMSDIVATIQKEQDDIIRSPHSGVLVVQGGPGTGKTAVALHRAAYLLYTQRERLARSGVLIVGPNTTFLRYIGDVLPSLGESGVLLATVGELYPGVRARRPEAPAAAEVKGRASMAGVLAAAVRDRQEVPDAPFDIVYDEGTARLDPDDCAEARRVARESGLPHNQAAAVFRELALAALARGVAAQFGQDVLDGSSLLTAEDLEIIAADLAASPEVSAALDALWPRLTPQRLLRELYASPERLAAAAPGLTAEERAGLLRPLDRLGWSVADVPLLDEAAELLGDDPAVLRAAEEEAAAERAERLALAGEALDIAYGSRTTDFDDGEEAEQLAAFDLIDAERLAERQAERDTRDAAERAAADRTWAFGHVVVDEAQELSAMAWRVLMRRCPARSMTVVGDIAQTGAPGGSRGSWADVLGPHVGSRFRRAELTVNYRLPARIAAVAAGVLHRIDPAARPPRAVRDTPAEPWRLAVPREELVAAAVRRAARECAGSPEGRVAVLAPAALVPALAAGAAAAGLPDRVDVLDVGRAKGLEFDSVLVADPDGIAAASPRGLNDLYVALTRATQRLGVLHTGRTPPEPLALLRPPAAAAG